MAKSTRKARLNLARLERSTPIRGDRGTPPEFKGLGPEGAQKWSARVRLNHIGRALEAERLAARIKGR